MPLAPSLTRRVALLAMAAVLGLSTALVGCDADQGIPYSGDPEGTVFEIIAQLSATETLEQAIRQAGLEGTLSQAGPYTVFAPTNQFVGTFLARTARLRNDEALLPKALAYHVVPGALSAADLTDGRVLTTLTGDQLQVSVREGRTYVNDVLISRADIRATNGYVHLIQGVLLDHFTLEERARVQPNLQRLLAALYATGLLNPDGPGGPLEELASFTIFAPTDAAFAQYARLANVIVGETSIQAKILPYHVVPNQVLLAGALAPGQTYETAAGIPLQIRALEEGGLSVDNAPITVTNIRTANGVIHLIGDLLTRPLTVGEQVTIRPDFAPLERALRRAGLFDASNSSQQAFTVLGPTDAAFAGLPTPAIPLLTGPGTASGDVLTLGQKVLNYHIVPGVYCEDPARLTRECTPITNQVVPTRLTDAAVTTVQFGRAPNGRAMANEVRFAVGDIEAVNGVLHGIEAVLTDPLNLLDVTLFYGLTTLRAQLAARGLSAALAAEPADPSARLTVFAPTDAAFSAIINQRQFGTGTAYTGLPAAKQEAVLRYHVVSGPYCFNEATVAGCTLLGTAPTPLPTLQGAPLRVEFSQVGGYVIRDAIKSTPIATADIRATNGVLHLIPSVQAPPDVLSVARLPQYSSSLGAAFYALISGTGTNPNYQPTFAALDNDAQGPFTVFAFSNLAWDANSATQFTPLTPVSRRVQVVRNHIVQGAFRAADLTNGLTLTTIDGNTLTVQRTEGQIRLLAPGSSATVIGGNGDASNGYVHYVDNFLIPTFN